MKRIIYSLIVLSVIIGCSEDSKFVFNGPSLAHFTNTSDPYFVLESNDPGFDVEVGVTKISNTAATYTITVDEENSTAIQGVDYTIPSTVTIPANSAVGTIKITGNFDTLTEPKTLVLKLANANGVAQFNTDYTVTLQQFCPYNQADFVGTYLFTSTAFEAEYLVEVIAGATPNELIAVELYDVGKNVKIVLNDSDPANFTARVNSQPAWVSGVYGVASVKGTGTFNACSKTISLALEHTVSAGSFGTYDETLVKQ